MFKNKLRIHLGIIITNYKKKKLLNKNTCEDPTLRNIRIFWPSEYEKIEIIYDCYMNLIENDSSYRNLPLIENLKSNRLFYKDRKFKWDFRNSYNYSVTSTAELIIKNIKNYKYILSLCKKYDSIGPNDRSRQKVKNIIFHTDNVDWQKMIKDDVREYCPSCGNPFYVIDNNSFFSRFDCKNTFIEYYSIRLDDSRIIFQGEFTCGKCTVMNYTRNKQFIQKLSSDLDELIIQLLKLNNKLGIKYYPRAMIDNIEKLNRNIISRFSLYILKKSQHERLDVLITLLLLKKKFRNYFNYLFKIVFEYI